MYYGYITIILLICSTNFSYWYHYYDYIYFVIMIIIIVFCMYTERQIPSLSNHTCSILLTWSLVYHKDNMAEQG